MSRKVVLTGMRTTGLLHLGHVVGALKNWKLIQDQGEYICYFLLADYQAATTHNNAALLQQAIVDVARDWLSFGIDPTLPHVHFVLQSQVVGRADLSKYLNLYTSYNELIRNQTLRQEMKRLDFVTLSFIDYPADQSADIHMVNPYPYDPESQVLVPVGKDQRKHLELARNTVSRYNRDKGNLFNPCTPLIGDIGTLPGTDGQVKMGKSLNNAIFLTDTPDVVRDKVMKMYTDPKHLRVEDPGDARHNPVFLYLQAFHPDKKQVKQWARQYTKGGLGDVFVKQQLVAALNDHFLPPIRTRRQEVASADIHSILIEGTMEASAACEPIVAEVRRVLGLHFPSKL